jgi:RNA polymerase sigma-70 factor (ECF subfamily)
VPEVELYSFDVGYVERLRAGEPAVQQHFCSYFNQLLLIKLRARMLPRHVIDDVCQETFLRVLTALRRDGGLEHPERLGAFVNSVCNNVLLEQYRSASRTESLEGQQEPPDECIDMDRALVSAEAKIQVEEILGGLGRRDRQLLRALFLEERSKDQICRDLGVDREYLRVLLHRAKLQFREKCRHSRFAVPAGGNIR